MKLIRYPKGNSLIEYSLPVAMLVLSLIPMVPLLLNEGILESFQGILVTHGVQNGSLVVSGFGSSAVTGAATGGNTNPSVVDTASGFGKSLTLTLANGQTIHLKDYPSDLGSAIETSGANGTTYHLAKLLETLGQDLAAQGSLDPATIDTILTLSNQAYRMAQMQKLVEEAAKASHENLVAYNSTKLIYEGKTYSPFQLSNLLGAGNPNGVTYTGSYSYPPQLDTYLYDQKVYVEVGTLLNLYYQAEQNGGLSDPTVKATIDHLVSQIVIVSDALENEGHRLHTGAETNPSLLTNNVASKVTKENAGNICTTGNGNNVDHAGGVTCQ